MGLKFKLNQGGKERDLPRLPGKLVNIDFDDSEQLKTLVQDLFEVVAYQASLNIKLNRRLTAVENIVKALILKDNLPELGEALRL